MDILLTESLDNSFFYYLGNNNTDSNCINILIPNYLTISFATP